VSFVRAILMLTELPVNTSASRKRGASLPRSGRWLYTPADAAITNSIPSLRLRHGRREVSFACAPRSGFTTLVPRIH
jgi:hypothetical protein